MPGMRRFACLLAALALPAAAANPDALPAPEGWRRETFAFPLAFAPGIPYLGMEHVRFSPGWARFGEETGFSYVILWDLKAAPVTGEDMEDHLEIYFTGLMKNVASGRKLEANPVAANAALHPMTAITGWTQAYGAEVRTWNAFSRGEPLLLFGEISLRDCPPARTQVFFAFSKAPRDRKVWDSLRAVRNATPCDPARNQ